MMTALIITAVVIAALGVAGVFWYRRRCKIMAYEILQTSIFLGLPLKDIQLIAEHNQHTLTGRMLAEILKDVKVVQAPTPGLKVVK